MGEGRTSMDRLGIYVGRGTAPTPGDPRQVTCEYRENGECWNCGCCADASCCDPADRCSSPSASKDAQP